MFVNGRCDIALATRASGVQLGQRHVPVADAKALCPGVLVGCSVHTPSEVDAAVGEGADFLLAGSIYDTPSHEGRAGTGVEFVSRAASTGVPVIAVGGLTSARAREVRDAGAWGVAAIRALWDAADPAQATLDLMAPWREM